MKGKKVNSKEKKPIVKDFLRKFGVFILIGVAFGAVGGIFLTQYLEQVFNDNTILVLFALYGILVLFMILILFHIIIHEAGHLIFGLLTGYTFVSFRVGSLTIVRENGKLKRKKYNMPGTAGQCLMAPPPKQGEEFPYLMYNYGGVLMNFMTSALAVAFILLFPDMPVLLQIGLGSYAGGGFLLGITNGIPMKSMGIANDGYNVKCMKKDSFARKAFYLQLDVNAKQSGGMRLKEMPPEWFQLPEGADLSNVLISFIILIEYYRYLDMMDFEAAKMSLKALEPVLEQLPSGYKNLYNLERLFMKLYNEESASEVEECLTKEVKILLKTGKNDISIKRIAFTYQVCYVKDEKAAKKTLKEAKVLAGKYPVKAEADSHMNLIEFIRNRAAILAEEAWKIG